MCAEYSRLWATSGVGDGAGSGYTADQLFEMYRFLFTGAIGANRGGVAPDYGSKLAVTGATSPISVADGAALVYGIPYANTTPVSVSVPTPTTATRIDRVVLRASWAAQTVRVTRIAGVEGAGAPPNLQQSAGVTWDIPLAQVAITTGGVLTLTDERQYLQVLGDGGVGTAKLANAAVTTAKLADSAVTSAKIADGAIATADLANGAVTGAKIADATITGGKLVAGTIAWTQLGDNIVYANNLADGQVTNAKLIDMAQATIKGRAAGAGTGDPTDLTPAQVVGIVATADGTGSGLDADLLDGQHAAAFAAAGHTHGDTPNSGLADMAQATIKGRAAGAGTGDPQDLSAAQVATILAGKFYAPNVDMAAGDYVSVGPYERVWRPGVQIGGTQLGEYGPTLTYNAKLVGGAWKSIAAGTPVALGVVEGQLLLGVGLAVAAGDLAITWTVYPVHHQGYAPVWSSLAAGGYLSGTVYYRKLGDMVHVRAALTRNGVGSGWLATCTLPAGYRPPFLTPAIVQITDGSGLNNSNEMAAVLPSGQVYVWTDTTKSNHYLNLQFAT